MRLVILFFDFMHFFSIKYFILKRAIRRKQWLSNDLVNLLKHSPHIHWFESQIYILRFLGFFFHFILPQRQTSVRPSLHSWTCHHTWYCLSSIFLFHAFYLSSITPHNNCFDPNKNIHFHVLVPHKLILCNTFHQSIRWLLCQIISLSQNLLHI